MLTTALTKKNAIQIANVNSSNKTFLEIFYVISKVYSSLCTTDNF